MPGSLGQSLPTTARCAMMLSDKKSNEFLAPLGLGTAYSPTGHAAEPVFKHDAAFQEVDFVISEPEDIGFWSFQASGYRILEFPGLVVSDFGVSAPGH